MDMDTIRQYSLRVWQAKQGEMVALMIHIGEHLDLFSAMADGSEMTVDDLAEAAGCHPRPLREWLHGLAAADIVEHSDGRFRLPPEGVPVLVDEESSLFFAAGAFAGTWPEETVDAVVGLMTGGDGTDYDALGDDMALVTERLTGPFNRLALVPMVLPQLTGLTDALQRGGSAAEVGCGAATAAEAVARAFPAARVSASDPSARALDRARARVGDVGNLTLIESGAEDLAGGPYDLIMALDCLHDMPRPDLAVEAMRRELADGGVVLIKELRSAGDLERNRRNPLLAMFYGFSLIGCLQSGMSTPDGWGLGNTGLHEEALTELVSRHGFATMRVLHVSDPANAYYEVRV